MGRNHLLYPVELQGRGTYEQELYLHMLTCGYACKHIPVARQSYRGHTTVGQNVRLVAIVLALLIETRLAHIGSGTALIRFRNCCHRTRATPGTQGRALHPSAATYVLSRRASMCPILCRTNPRTHVADEHPWSQHRSRCWGERWNCQSDTGSSDLKMFSKA